MRIVTETGFKYSSRVFLDANGKAVGSVSADGETVSSFTYKAAPDDDDIAYMERDE